METRRKGDASITPPADRAKELDTRGRRLRAALASVLVNARAPELALVHRWLDGWAGIGLVVVGMAHQGYQVSLGEHGTARWIAIFYRAGGGHEPVVAAGTAQEATAWRAAQRAAWQALCESSGQPRASMPIATAPRGHERLPRA